MGAVTAPLMAPLMPAASAGGAAAEQVGTQTAANVGTEATKQAAIQSTLNPANMGITTLGNEATNSVLGAAGNEALGNTLTAGSMNFGSGIGAGAGGSAGGSTVGGGLGALNTTALNSAIPSSYNALAASTPGFFDTMAGKAAIGAGIGGLGGAVTNPNDPLKGALVGAGAGALGGAGQSALAGQAGAGGILGNVGSFAAEHPYITSAALSVPTSMALNSMTAGPSAEDDLNAANASDREQYLRYLRQYRPSVPPGYAAGGITDLDGYMSNAQNIPNPNEVADPEGYPTSSVRMMAGGGLSSLIPGGQGGADWLAKNSLPGMIFGWEGAHDIPLIGGMFNDPNIANLSPEEKKKLLDMAAAQGQAAPTQAMAQGGIADLGGYAAGGRPNLLHGPGDGVSDDIPASIAGKQPARLASGEYVIPSRIVSELGNGSTDAGAKRLDMMVQKVNAGRSQTLGGKKYAKDTRAYKHLPV
jgi:hypothetical protein